jgi:hypothetical protein
MVSYFSFLSPTTEARQPDFELPAGMGGAGVSSRPLMLGEIRVSSWMHTEAVGAAGIIAAGDAVLSADERARRDRFVLRPIAVTLWLRTFSCGPSFRGATSTHPPTGCLKWGPAESRRSPRR